MSLFTEPLVIRHPGGETGEYDDLGRPVKDPPTDESVMGWYEPRSSSEDVEAKNQQIDGYWVYLPTFTTVGPDALIKIEGDWFEVDGEPGRMPGGYLLSGYLAVAARRVRG